MPTPPPPITNPVWNNLASTQRQEISEQCQISFPLGPAKQATKFLGRLDQEQGRAWILQRSSVRTEVNVEYFIAAVDDSKAVVPLTFTSSFHV
jgi:hypothetical protein